MARFTVNFNSYTLRNRTDLTVIIPSSNGYDPKTGYERHNYAGKPFPVLYLLHGFAGDYSTWLTRTDIERYAKRNNIAVIMPSGYNGAYTDLKYGMPYATYLTEELPEFVQAMFPVSDKREDTFIAGFSMGGYGALKTALNRPDLYAAAASISGSLDVANRLKGSSTYQNEVIMGMYGDPPAIDPETQDIYYMLDRARENGACLPRLFAMCGRQDEGLWATYCAFKEYCLKHNLDVRLEEDDGVHDYTLCNIWIPRIIQWMLGTEK